MHPRNCSRFSPHPLRDLCPLKGRSRRGRADRNFPLTTQCDLGIGANIYCQYRLLCFRKLQRADHRHSVRPHMSIDSGRYDHIRILHFLKSNITALAAVYSPVSRTEWTARQTGCILSQKNMTHSCISHNRNRFNLFQCTKSVTKLLRHILNLLPDPLFQRMLRTPLTVH